jgi:hypothetical protein
VNVITLIFLLLVLLWLLSCFLPNWTLPLVLTPGSMIRCIIGLLVLFVLYLIVTGFFGGVRVGT